MRFSGCLSGPVAYCLLPAILVMVVVARAQDEEPSQETMSPEAKKYLDFLTANRDRQIAALESQIKQAEENAQKLSKGRVRRAVKQMKAQIEAIRAHFEELQGGALPNRYIYSPKFAAGQLGRISEQLRVAQVVSDSEMFVVPVEMVAGTGRTPDEARRRSYTREGERFLIKGMQTEGFTDGVDINWKILPSVFAVVGTKTYRTAIGGTNTVFVLEPFDMAKIKPQLEKRAAKHKAKRKKPPTAGRRSTDPETLAAGKLRLARPLIERNRIAAQERLHEIVEKYPGTEAAKEARKLLEDFQ